MLCALTVTLTAATAWADPKESAAVAGFLAQPLSSLGGVVEPIPAWTCGALDVASAPAVQSILDMHMNWHCTYDSTINPGLGRFPNDGNRFFGFHRQFLYAFNEYRRSQGLPFVQTWMPFPNALIPLGHSTRPDNRLCRASMGGLFGCDSLPNTFRLPAAGGTLDPATTTLVDYGNRLVPWHNGRHMGMADAGAPGGEQCVGAREIECITTAPRDPMFFRFHNFVNDLQDELLTFQDTDVMIVLDRSGSMTLPNGRGSDTRLNSAKNAALLFADLMRDASNNRLGLVSFSTMASPSPEMPLTLASSAPAAMSTAVTGILAGGSTSIGDGLRRAVAALNTSSNPNKAILLLTDGVENTAPMIVDVQGRSPDQLRDTHVCAVGFGTPGSLDGPKLRDLGERQGGAYRSDADDLTLKKFFVECFADIFDTFVGKDPVAALPVARVASAPTVHVADGDGEVTFVLSWDDPLPPGSLRLAVTSPSGTAVNLSDANVESRFGPSWHIVRVKLPYGGEQNGSWTARAVRPVWSYLNGFAPDAFKDPDVGAAVAKQQLAQLCPAGCNNVLYYDPFKPSPSHGSHGSAYYAALTAARVAGVVGSIERVSTPDMFADRLNQGGYNLVVATLGSDGGPQPYDGPLSERACRRERGPKLLLSDIRAGGNERLLRCLGAMRAGETNYGALKGDGQVFSGSVGFEMGMGGMPGMSHGVRTASFRPTGAAGASVPALTPAGNAGVIGIATSGPAQRYFIEALASGAARVRPFTYRAPNYTREALHPTFHIPETYWPMNGFDKVTARVEITRPLASIAVLAGNVAPRGPGRIGGDPLSLTQTASLRYDPNQQNQVIPTETRSFALNDQGRDGDTSPRDRYWEVSVPPAFAKFDGVYTYHAYFTLCRQGRCIDREATQAVAVDTKLDPGRTRVEVQALQAGVARVLVTPRDAGSLPLGPGRADTLRVQGEGTARVLGIHDLDGKGTYAINVNHGGQGSGSVTIAQEGRPQDALKVNLP